MPVLGPHAVTVPGGVAGWFDLLERWGTRSFGELAEPALAYARVTASSSRRWARCISAVLLRCTKVLRRSVRRTKASKPATCSASPGSPAPSRRSLTDGPDAYYHGPIANAIADTTRPTAACSPPRISPRTRANGSSRSARRIASRDRRAAATDTRGHRARGSPYPGRLPAARRRARPSPLLIEATKLALQDRDDYVSDPDAMRVTPSEMLAEDWIADRRSLVDLQRATMPRPGAAHVGGTAYLCAADADGMLVSLIQSNFLSFGSGVHVADWGINLNNRGSSFTFDATAVNALAPAKLPMHTLIPAMAMQDGEPRCAFGSMGGDSQAQIHVQLLARLVDDLADPRRARPRHAGASALELDATRRARLRPGVVRRATGARPRPPARARGDAGMGHAHAIQRTAGGYAVATNPRAEGAALGL